MKANTGSVKLCNVLFPIWILIFFPQVLAIVIPGNLIVDAAVLLLALAAMRHRAKGAVLRRCWWKVWLLGFAADLIGAAWMVLGWLLATWLPGGAETLGKIMYNSFGHPAAFLWTAAGVAIAGWFIFLLDRRVFRSVPELTSRQSTRLALTFAIVTAPWLFFLPLYSLY